MADGAVRAVDLTLPADSEVDQLIARVVPGAEVVPLAGSMNRNVRLRLRDGAGGRWPGDLVLRVYQRYVTGRRVLAIQGVRRALADRGLRTPVAIGWQGSTVLRCGGSCAELESYLPHRPLEQSWEGYRWLFGAMGELHRALARLDVAVPRPRISFYAAPSTLQRGARLTRPGLDADREATLLADRLDQLLARVRRSLPSARDLPAQIVHGDVNPENISRAADGAAVYLDFGFTAYRPRIHDLAFTLVHTVLRTVEGAPRDPRYVPWHRIVSLIAEYERAAGPLTAVERQAIGPYAAAVLLFFPATGYFSRDPSKWLKGQKPTLQLAGWLLDKAVNA